MPAAVACLQTDDPLPVVLWTGCRLALDLWPVAR